MKYLLAGLFPGRLDKISEGTLLYSRAKTKQQCTFYLFLSQKHLRKRQRGSSPQLTTQDVMYNQIFTTVHQMKQRLRLEEIKPEKQMETCIHLFVDKGLKSMLNRREQIAAISWWKLFKVRNSSKMIEDSSSYSWNKDVTSLSMLNLD